MTQEPDIFTKLIPSEKEKFLNDVELEKPELICKLPQMDDLIRLRPTRREGDRLLCQPLGTEKLSSPASAVISLLLRVDRYFITTKLSERKDGVWEIDTSADVFQLQRRQNFRLRIPTGYQAFFHLGRVNGKTAKLSGPLLDFSTGGCRGLLRSPGLALNDKDQVEGLLQIDSRPDIAFTAEIRHLKNQDSEQVVGMEFTRVSAPMEARFFAIIMELHRELYGGRTE